MTSSRRSMIVSFILISNWFIQLANGINDEQVCSDIIVIKETILWIGMMRSRFVLMTSQGNVFDMSTSSLDYRGFHLYLTGFKTRKQIYPVLDAKIHSDGTGYFQGTEKRLTVVDEKGEYLYVETSDRKNGNAYDITHKTTMYYKVDDELKSKASEPQVSLSSSQALTFYWIKYDSESDRTGMFSKATFIGGKTLKESTILKPASETYFLCRTKVAADQVYMNRKKCKPRLEWKVTQGFVDSYNFYLLGENQTVLIFSTSAFTNPGTAVKLNLIKYGDFFICHGPSKGKMIVQ